MVHRLEESHLTTFQMNHMELEFLNSKFVQISDADTILQDQQRFEIDLPCKLDVTDPLYEVKEDELFDVLVFLSLDFW